MLTGPPVVGVVVRTPVVAIALGERLVWPSSMVMDVSCGFVLSHITLEVVEGLC